MVGEDRISSLSPDLLAMILSRTSSSRTVVQSSLVSRGWRTAWKRVRVADLRGLGGTPNAVNRFRLFCTSFMLSLAMHPILPIYSFLLKVNSNDLCDFAHVYLWLETALQREVQTVCMFFPLATEITLPLQVLSCKSLVSLKLENIKAEGISDDVQINLPNLRIFHSYGHVFQNPEHIRLLLKNCPELEELKLVGLGLHIEDLGGCFQNLSKVILSSTSMPLDELWNVKFMRLSHLTHTTVIFSQLTHLDLSLVRQCNWLYLWELLNLSPSVQKLELRCSGSAGLADFPIPNCISSGLKHCTLTNFSDAADLKLATTLMENARELLIMTICFSSQLSGDTRLTLVHEANMVRRLSVISELEFE